MNLPSTCVILYTLRYQPVTRRGTSVRCNSPCIELTRLYWNWLIFEVLLSHPFIKYRYTCTSLLHRRILDTEVNIWNEWRRPNLCNQFIEPKLYRWRKRVRINVAFLRSFTLFFRDNRFLAKFGILSLHESNFHEKYKNEKNERDVRYRNVQTRGNLTTTEEHVVSCLRLIANYLYGNSNTESFILRILSKFSISHGKQSC